RVPRIRFNFHNTRNTGYANAAVASSLDGLGTIALDASMRGFGGCPFAPAATGNSATEDLTDLLPRDGVDVGTRLAGRALTAGAAPGNLATEDLPYLLQRAGVDIGTRLEIPAMPRVATWLADELDSPVQGLLARAGDFPGGSLR